MKFWRPFSNDELLFLLYDNQELNFVAFDLCASVLLSCYWSVRVQSLLSCSGVPPNKADQATYAQVDAGH